MDAKRLSLSAAALLGVAFLSIPAQAAEVRLNGLGGYERLTASDSAKAVFDSTGGVAFGGEITVDLGGGVFVGAGARTFSKEGERAFVADPSSEPFRLGHPLKLRVTPIYALGGYRFGRPESLFHPYISGGLGIALYRERSEIAGLVETLDTSKFTALGALGVEFGRGSLRFGLDAAYIAAPDALGAGGVSAVYDEKDAGGFVISGRLSFAFGQR